MKYLIIILSVIILAVGIYFGYDYLSKKKKSDEDQTEPDTTPRDEPDTNPNPNPKNSSTQAVKNLQTYLNANLPDSEPKLIVDGIFGEKTKRAFILVKQKQNEKTMNEMDSSLLSKVESEVSDSLGSVWNDFLYYMEIKKPPKSESLFKRDEIDLNRYRVKP